MPIDAPTAAIIGALVGGSASTVAAVITSNVTRQNSYRQHLYEKRLELYEEIVRSATKATASDARELTSDLQIRTQMLGSRVVALELERLTISVGLHSKTTLAEMRHPLLLLHELARLDDAFENAKTALIDAIVSEINRSPRRRTLAERKIRTSEQWKSWYLRLRYRFSKSQYL